MRRLRASFDTSTITHKSFASSFMKRKALCMRHSLTTAGTTQGRLVCVTIAHLPTSRAPLGHLQTALEDIAESRIAAREKHLQRPGGCSNGYTNKGHEQVPWRGGWRCRNCKRRRSPPVRPDVRRRTDIARGHGGRPMVTHSSPPHSEPARCEGWSPHPVC